MHVVFRRVRNFEIDYVRQFVDVQAACCDIGGHEHQCGAVLESFECLQAVELALVAVDRVGGDARALQFASQTVGLDLGAREYQHLVELG